MILFDWFLAGCQAQLAFWSWPFRPHHGIPTEMREDVRELLDAFRTEVGEPQLIPSLLRLSELLDEVTTTLRWNQGMRSVLLEIVARSVDAAEQRFGPNHGEFKRQFVTDVVIRVLSREYLGVPLPGFVESAARPLVGIFIDWTVEVLNVHRGKLWYDPPGRRRVPRRYAFHPIKWKTYRRLLWLWSWVAGLFVPLSAYERRLREVSDSLEPQAKAMRELMPVESIAGAASKVGNVIVDLGVITKPHVRTVEAVLRFTRSQLPRFDDPEERHMLLVTVVQELLCDAYRGEPLMNSAIRSGVGTFVIGEMVRGIEHVLDRADLLLPAGSVPTPSTALVPLAGAERSDHIH